jgi:hypothetical protein
MSKLPRWLNALQAAIDAVKKKRYATNTGDEKRKGPSVGRNGINEQ